MTGAAEGQAATAFRMRYEDESVSPELSGGVRISEVAGSRVRREVVSIVVWFVALLVLALLRIHWSSAFTGAGFLNALWVFLVVMCGIGAWRSTQDFFTGSSADAAARRPCGARAPIHPAWLIPLGVFSGAFLVFLVWQEVTESPPETRVVISGVLR